MTYDELKAEYERIKADNRELQRTNHSLGVGYMMQQFKESQQMQCEVNNQLRSKMQAIELDNTNLKRKNDYLQTDVDEFREQIKELHSKLDSARQYLKEMKAAG
jgi:predicted nuclease with TOPRIM domain